MIIDIKQTAEEVLVKMTGSLDTLASEQSEQQVVEIEAMADKPIAIDCIDLDYIASSGLRLLLRIRKAAAAKSNKVKLIGVNDNIMEVLRVTHFDKMFDLQ